MIGIGHRYSGKNSRALRFNDKAFHRRVVFFEGRGAAGNGLTRSKLPGGFCVGNNLAGNSILFGKARVEIFQLGQYAAIHVSDYSGQIHEGRVSDCFDGRGI
jgi:hypothetical protein